MNDLHILMIGAGEFRSFSDDAETSYFARFERADGKSFDLPLTEEQLGTIIGFASGSERAAPPPPPPPPQGASAGQPAAGEDDAPAPVQLRPPPRSRVQVFAGEDDEL